MKTNVEKVLERDQKLSELDDRAGKHSPAISIQFIKFVSFFRCVAAGGLTVRTAGRKAQEEILAAESKGERTQSATRAQTN